MEHTWNAALATSDEPSAAGSPHLGSSVCDNERDLKGRNASLMFCRGLAEELWELRKRRKARDEELLFTGRGGGTLDASAAFRDVKAAAKLAGVPWAGPHTLRHTCATMLFRNGLNAKQVQLWLGHHSPAFTLATYVHLLADDLPETTFLDEIVFSPPARVDRHDHSFSSRRRLGAGVHDGACA